MTVVAGLHLQAQLGLASMTSSRFICDLAASTRLPSSLSTPPPPNSPDSAHATTTATNSTKFAQEVHCMSETCIVCLGDLSNGNGDVPAISTTLAKSPPSDDADSESKATDAYPTTTTTRSNDAANVPELIAHLQPCGHDLHNDCLTPWVERANSCPICRASFHLVELMDKVGGNIVSSYPVQERTQIAELDPSMFLEIPAEEDDDQPCQGCGEDDNEDVLMYCDGCQKLWHTYCVGLQEVPHGHWFCDNCRSQREVDPRLSARAARSSRRRTRGQQRRQRGYQAAHDSSWNEVWQSVWTRLNIDLDFPYEDDETSAAFIRRARQRNQQNNRAAHDAWLRRMQVAELHGAGNRFRETEPTIASSPGGVSTPAARQLRSSPLPHVESADEMLAWDAFDQARAASGEPPSRKKKRKSRTTSPAEPEADAEPADPVIKRRRISTSADVEPDEVGSSSRPHQRLRRASPLPTRQPFNDSATPSFLQSLLQEVEDSSTATNHFPNLHRPSPRVAGSPPAEQQSPRPSSPALSPLPSNHSSPRAMSATPPPLSAVRPISPSGLSSTIQPIFPSTEYSPRRSGSPEPRESNPSEHTSSRLTTTALTASSPVLAQPRPRSRVPRMLDPSSSLTNGTRSHDASPARATLSLTAKSDVQRLVSTALKPHYNDQTISKDEYTVINRDISRMLYDKIGDFEALDVNGKAKWEKVAGEEVAKAVVALKEQA